MAGVASVPIVNNKDFRVMGAVPPPPPAGPPLQSSTVLLQPQLPSSMSSSQQDAGDNRSIPGTDRVDELAEYLVELREQTGLTLNNQQVSTILGFVAES
ncbi:hypothetical protein D4764_07G0011890 [Takifugu flavidus]|uniref:Uncharacterized protein n=1 Tax=Takifugu flavidus TaxID=433684 RepID=A0A5C6MYG9_9TELE|nr:hypothetical protein D4764_07G0011890 [Takifugu flavidus]